MPRPLYPSVLFSVSLSLIPAVAAIGQVTPTSGTYAFVNVEVIPMEAPGTLPDHTVVVRDGRIVVVGPSASVEVPADATRIEGEGRFLMPGLVDMAARLPGELDPMRVIVLEEWLYLYLANGVTRIRALGGSPYQLDLKEQIGEREVLGPRLYVGSPPLDSVSAPDAATAAAFVGDQAEAGYDFLTLESGLPAAAWEGVVRAAEAASLPLAGSGPGRVDLEAVLEAGPSTLDGLSDYLEPTRSDGLASATPNAERFSATDQQELEHLAQRTAESGVYVVPKQYLQNHLHGWNHLLGGSTAPDSVKALPEFQHVPQSVRNDWVTTAWNAWIPPAVTPESAAAYAEWRTTLLSALRSAGAPILVGTGAADLFNVPGFAIHREMPLLAAAGLSTYEVLQAATTTPAQFVAEQFGEPGDFGAVKEDYVGDLILLDDSPLESLDAFTSTVGVMANGVWLTQEEIAERLAAMAERHKDYEID
ncbi:MAG: hypothetical protein GEU90_14615 [Gemmatimonas sp.]|nr:hypothetical protein [Gemmatimonas sp.]